MLWQGIAPQGHDPVVDAIPAVERERALAALRSAALAAAPALSGHADFIRFFRAT
jgi:hypothetical protein